MSKASFPTIYVALFWLNAAQTVADKIACLDRERTKDAAIDYLRRLKLEEGYARWVAMRISQWNGVETLVTELTVGNLVMLSTPLEGENPAQMS